MKILLASLSFSLISTFAAAQNVGFTYQAVAIDASKAEGLGRDSRGEILVNKSLRIRFSLHEAYIDGPVVYQETHETSTDIFGIFRLIVGRGYNVSGTAIDKLMWGETPYFLEVEIDLGSGFEYLGVEELLGSPYSLNRKKQLLTLDHNLLSITDGNSVTLSDNDASNELINSFTLAGTQLQIADAGGIKVVDLAPLFTCSKLTEGEVDHFVSNNGYLASEADGSETNELQTISRVGTDITLSNNGGTISVADNDNNSQNEMQDLDLTGAVLRITNNPSATPIDLSSLVTEEQIDEFANDNGYLTSESQNISTNGSAGNISISNGSTINLNVNDADADPVNEIQDLQINGTILSITNNATATSIDFAPFINNFNLTEVEVDAFANNNGYLTSESQNIATDGTAGNISITNGANLNLNVNDADADPANEIQDLALAGNNLSITNNPAATAIDLSGYQNVFETTNGVTSNENGNYATDDFVFGSSSTNYTGESSKFFFDKSKSAFRAGSSAWFSTDGQSITDNWDDQNVGNRSIGLGWAPRASGSSSVAIGYLSQATGLRSVAIGNESVSAGPNTFAIGNAGNASTAGAFAIGNGGIASGSSSFAVGNQVITTGNNSFAFGNALFSRSSNELSIGSNNTDYVPISAVLHNNNDRLFTIGNGSSPAFPSNALVMLKNGNTRLHGQLTIDADNVNGAGESYTLPAQDGNANQIMSTDGNGNVSWVNPSQSLSETEIDNLVSNNGYLTTEVDGSVTNEIQDLTLIGNTLSITNNVAATAIDLSSFQNVFETTNGVTSNENGDYANDDFVFGSPQLASTGNPIHSHRMFFDKSKGAFRAGTGGAWDNVNVGVGSVAFGNSRATADWSFAIGNNSYATGLYSFAAGQTSYASGSHAVALGNAAYATGNYSVSLGGSSNATNHYAVAMGQSSLASGHNSTAIGGATASGSSSLALGSSANANGNLSVAVGNGARADGAQSAAIGLSTYSDSFGQISLGFRNTTLLGQSPNSFVPTDRLLVVGNGLGLLDRSDALVMLKNGNTRLHGQLTIDADNVNGAGESYTLPPQDGNANQVMTTDGNGNVSWVNAGTSMTEAEVDNFVSNNNYLTSELDGSVTNEIQDLALTSNILSITNSAAATAIDLSSYQNVFERTNGVTSNENGDYANDDFVFGSPILDNNFNFNHSSRMFFDKSSAAFRAGTSLGNGWSQTHIGYASAAFGEQTRAEGYHSFAAGNTTSAFGQNSFAAGNGSAAHGQTSFALGTFARAFSLSEVAVGSYNTEYTVAPGGDLTWQPTDRLFVIGNGTSSAVGSLSNALVMLKNGNTRLHGQLTIDADNVSGAGESYTLPAQDGNANQVMTTDGNGNVSWATALSGAFITSSSITSNGAGNYATDDFVFGSPTLAYSNNVLESDRMMFYKSKGAFRAGSSYYSPFYLNNTDPTSYNAWDDVNVGTYSAAFGRGSLVSGMGSFAAGSGNKVSGHFSSVFGWHIVASGDISFSSGYLHTVTGDGAAVFGSYNQASGSHTYASGSRNISSGRNSFSHGESLFARSFVEAVFGAFNSDYAPQNATAHNVNDRLFVVGNGSSSVSRSDALVILKNGNTRLHGQLTIDADNVNGPGQSYILPGQRGTNGQTLITDANGNVNWATPASNVFSTSMGVTSNTPGNLASDSFVFGSTSMDNNANVTENSRMFFDKSTGAFRAGTVTGTHWDATNRGTNSVAMGEGNIARGNYSVALGMDNLAHSESSVAIGTNIQAEGYNSIAIGRNVATTGTHSMGLAFYSAARSFGETVLGINATDVAPLSSTDYNAADRLLTIGNGQFGSPSDALRILKSGNTTLNGTLTIDADNVNGPGASYTLPGNDGFAGNFIVTDGAGSSTWTNVIPDLTVTNSFNNASDRRLKNQFSKLSNSLDDLSKVNGYHYHWNAKTRQDTVQVQTGVIAQELEEIFPELVKTEENGMKSVNYIGIIPHLIEAIKTLKAENEKLTIQNHEAEKNFQKSMNMFDDRLKAMETILISSQASANKK